ncbi:MAG TPA: tRNA adenosine(34) deaminase TadA [Pyrinomonadaceae bacterium]|nr:tRNA adenosine(34) deaminase TadA [Pyrinomonadaceae bacterium]
MLDTHISDTYSWPSLFEAMFSAAENGSATESPGELLTHERWMREALRAALEAGAAGEVPVGTCIVVGDEILAVAGNRTRTDCDPTAHAEIVALREAARKLGNYRLADAVVYSTIEPCAMCAGALIQARVNALVYGATDERAGAVESHFHICDADQLNHRLKVVKGVLEDECRALMQEFFRSRRQGKDEGKTMNDE